jgi:hypothetical protein
MDSKDIIKEAMSLLGGGLHYTISGYYQCYYCGQIYVSRAGVLPTNFEHKELCPLVKFQKKAQEYLEKE